MSASPNSKWCREASLYRSNTQYQRRTQSYQRINTYLFTARYLPRAMSSQPYMEYLDYIACLNILMHRLLIVLWQFLQALFVKLPLYKTPPPSLSVLVAHPVQLSQVVVMPMRQCVCFHSPTKVCNTTNASLLTTMDNYGVQQLPTMTLIICGAIVRVCVFF